MIERGIEEKVIYVSRRKETIVIDEAIRQVIEIMDRIIRAEENEVLKKVYKGIRYGKRENKILTENPIGRTLYYRIKGEFISKIMLCGVSEGLFNVDDLIKGRLL